MLLPRFVSSGGRRVRLVINIVLGGEGTRCRENIFRGGPTGPSHEQRCFFVGGEVKGRVQATIFFEGPDGPVSRSKLVLGEGRVNYRHSKTVVKYLVGLTENKW